MEDINFAPYHFDAVICHNVFHHFKNKLGILGKAAETLKPNGQFMIHHFLAFSEINNQARKIHDVVFQDLMPPLEQMQWMFSLSGLKITHYSNSDDGYIIRAVRA